MISVLIMLDLLYLLGIFIMRKDRREQKKTFQTIMENNRFQCRQVIFLKRMIDFSYVIEVLIWIFVGILTIAILKYFNLI